MNEVSRYISEIQKILQSGDAREHAYRPAFQRLIESITSDIQVINEPAYTGGNAPDFLFKKGDVPISYAECKDVTVVIADEVVQKQALRYVEAFGKILLTNYLEFQIIDENGEVARITIAERNGNVITSREERFDHFINLIRDYITPSVRTIRSAKKLAEIMASKARLLRDNSLAALLENKESGIYEQYVAFKEVLIHSLSEQEFADMYAQTLVYGLFVARYFDPSLTDFTRHEAHDLLPSTNPLLKKFFGHVAGPEFDPKIAWMVDSLIEAYKGADIKELMHREFEKKQKDPILHFYETFLAKYDQGLRKSRGVYYTPEPVVSFIVRSVDQILKTKFNLPKGLADTTKVDHKYQVQGTDGRTKDGSKKVTDQIHKVQILDPAVGTGTFLNEVIHEIYASFKGQEGQWSTYVREHLLPRLHGFELMMASYTMAHLKLGVTLKELGYEGVKERLSVWLTNSLEESVHEVPHLFMSQWLTQESNEASRIKSEMPIMVVMGNPPYSVSSSNKGKAIQDLIKVYKKDLNEKKINLDDDYIKFIRFAEHQVEKTGYGIVAMITNNSFIDGVTHRQMRKHLMETFDEIYIFDLHGNSKKKEKASDGSKDGNVFRIQQGVSINLFIKNGSGKEMAEVYYADIFGDQKTKYDYLNDHNLESIKWKKLEPKTRYWFFVAKDFSSEEEYKRGFSIDQVLPISNSGIKTDRDSLFVDINKQSLVQRIDQLLSGEYDTEFKSKYRVFNSSSYQLTERIKSKKFEERYIQSIQYRPFDYRWIYYDPTIISRPAAKVMRHLVDGENLALMTCRQESTFDFQHVLVTRSLTDICGVSLQTKETAYVFPLYSYAADNTRVPNLDPKIWKKINEIVGETKPEDVFDYIYAILHNPNYRSQYKEFLKIDFPRVPYPKNKNIFWQLVELGGELRRLHLLESSQFKFVTTFPESGSNIIEEGYPKYENEQVYINNKQYFGEVSKGAWEFYIGGYLPAQKWLKDRRSRTLTADDINHYQKIIIVLINTDRVMEILKREYEIF